MNVHDALSPCCCHAASPFLHAYVDTAASRALLPLLSLALFTYLPVLVKLLVSQPDRVPPDHVLWPVSKEYPCLSSIHLARSDISVTPYCTVAI